MGIQDSVELAMQDWMGAAGFDRDVDHWPRRWAEAYVHFAHGEKRAWLASLGVKWTPVVGWAERGAGNASGHGNSVPRFQLTWGTGPGVLEPFEQRVREHQAAGRITLRFRHRADELVLTAGTVTGVRGTLLEPSDVARGERSSRVEVGSFELSAEAVVVTSGGIGGDFGLVRRHWPQRLGSPPKDLIAGVPHHVDGRMLGIVEDAGASLVNRDRMWHYVEGIRNWDPIWPHHGIRIIPGPSSLWLDATGARLPSPLFPGADTLGTLQHLMATGHEHTWFVPTQRIIDKEFALSGSEQNPDVTGKNLKEVLRTRLEKGAPAPIEAFKEHGADFVVENNLESLVKGMNRLTDPPLLDPKAGPLIGVKLNLLTRKTLGGLETDLEGRVLRSDGQPLPGLYAAGEVAGFGGGGMHGYRSLEGSFLGGCLFSGRVVGRSLATTLS